MRITEDQLAVLDSFSCERLTANEANEHLIQSFENKRNRGLADYLKQNAWKEDKSNAIAFYLVKNVEGQILFFFSLKCGALFEHLDEEKLRQKVQYWEALKRILKDPKPEEESQAMANLIMEKIRSGQDIPDEEIKRLIKDRFAEKNYILETLSQEKASETNEHIVRVSSTYSGIELVHFCINDAAKDRWKEYGFQRFPGEIVFWKFIVPIMESVQKSIGCQYAFLFAADLSEEGSLINYYNVTLHFEQPAHIGTSKPYYDFCCRFMCQEICKLLQLRDEFFENFNRDACEELV